MAAPTISNLNGDNVARPGPANAGASGGYAWVRTSAVNLDVGANATLTSDDWSSTTIKVERSSGAWSADTFAVVAGGGLTVSGNSISDGTTTVATITSNTGGSLQIAFTGTATAATAAQLLKNITYRNDTSFGDATLRFTAENVSGPATADVVVTSNVIYADNADAGLTDNQGDVTDGVSLTEAFARGVAQSGRDYIIAQAASDSTFHVANGTVVGAGDVFTVTHFPIPITSGSFPSWSANSSERSAQNLTVSGSLVMAGGMTLTGANQTVTTLTGAISGTGGLTIYGYGSWKLSAANSFSGGVSLTNGSLTLGADAELGTGELSLESSSLILQNGANITRDVTIIGASVNRFELPYEAPPSPTIQSAVFAGRLIGGADAQIMSSMNSNTTLTFTGDNTSYTGAYAFSGNVVIENDWGAKSISFNPLTVYSWDAKLTFHNTDTSDPIVYGGSFLASSPNGAGRFGYVSKTGAGTVIFTAENNGAASNGAITWTISEGTLAVARGDMLGTAERPIILDGGMLEMLDTAYTPASNTLAQNIQMSDASTFKVNGDLAVTGTISGTGGALTVQAIGDVTASGVISDIVGLIKTGTGDLTLSGANTYASAVSIDAGSLTVASAAALGTTGAGTTVADGAALQIKGGVSVGAEALTLNGSGLSNGGALRNVSGANTYGGAVTLGSDARISSDAGTLTVSGAIATAAHDLTVGGAGNTTVSGVIGGAGDLTKAGAGTLILSATNTYSGATTVEAGGLLVNGVIASDVTVKTGGLLGGTGTVGDVMVQSGGKLSAGASAGVLNTGSLELAAGSSLRAEVASATSYDKIEVTGTVTLGGALDVSFLNAFAPISGTYTIIDNDGTDAVVGTFAGLSQSASFAVGTTQFTINYRGGDGNDVVLTASSLPVEPPPPPPGPPPLTPGQISTGFAGAVGFAPNSTKATERYVTLSDGRIVENPAYEAATALADLMFRYSAGTISRAYLIDEVVELAGPTTGVALLAYQFFTGGTPTQAGMTWLTDSPNNPNDLTDAYYANFNEVNRYLNFAVNLGVHGEGRAAFETGYGGLGFEASVRKAYDAIIGLDEARAAGVNIDAAISWVAGQQAYFEAVGGSALGAKAAMVGYLMYAGFSGRVGVYYDAAHDWLENAFNGAPTYGVDLVGRSGAPILDDLAA